MLRNSSKKTSPDSLRIEEKFFQGIDRLNDLVGKLKTYPFTFELWSHFSEAGLNLKAAEFMQYLFPPFIAGPSSNL